MDWHRPRMHTREAEVAALHARAFAAAPHRANHGDGLFQRGNRVAGLTSLLAHRGDGLGKPTGAQAELNPTAGHHIKRGGPFSHHGRTAHLQVDHVRYHPQPGGLYGDRGEQRERVQESRLVGMVLDPDQVKAKLIGQSGMRQDPFIRRRLRNGEVPE